MREILFRGKLDNGAWVEGVAFPHDRDKVTIFRQHPMDGSLEGKEVIPESVGEYTGVKDKNGTRIFEGDVIKDDKHLYLIEWYAGDFDAGFLPFICSENCRAVRSCNCEIIGDIHDNPELLEGDD